MQDDPSPVVCGSLLAWIPKQVQDDEEWQGGRAFLRARLHPDAMNAPLYNTQILRLAASIPHHERLADPMGSSAKRSPVCGSQVTVDIDLSDGRVSAVGMLVRACALGQASASLLAANAIGKTPVELDHARDQLTAWLAGSGPQLDWPDMDIFAPALAVTARHPSIRLAFEAAAEAAALAEGTR